MPLKVLIAPDKFKGTLSATAAADALARGWRKARPRDAVSLLPMSDGGEGFGEVMGRLLGAEARTVSTVDAAGRPTRAPWWWEQKTATAIIESATAIGLALLPPGKFHPFELDTFGLGAILRAAASAGAKRCLLGIGGSATNDGGFGVARVLGWRFLDGKGKEIERWTELQALEHLEAPKGQPLFEEMVVAVDVQNPLLGPLGCTRIFGPQKGLREKEFEAAERCLLRWAEIAAQHTGRNSAGENGAGAAGGLGFGLRVFAGAKLEPGFEMFSRHANLTERVKSASVVLTGEGRLDEQTFMGKGVGRLAEMCREMGVPCIAFAGEIPQAAPLPELFHQMFAVAPELTSRAEAMRQPAVWLEKSAEIAAEEFE